MHIHDSQFNLFLGCRLPMLYHKQGFSLIYANADVEECFNQKREKIALLWDVIFQNQLLLKKAPSLERGTSKGRGVRKKQKIKKWGGC